MATLGVQRNSTSQKGVRLTSRGFPSLFRADSDDETSSDSGGEREQNAQPSRLPLNEVITHTPKTLATLLDLLLPRLQPSADVKSVSLRDQKSLMNALVGELASQFSVIQHQIDDPFLNPQQNKDLHRRVVVRVCEIIEELYQQFLAKTAAVDSGAVFSAAANLSRVRAQLTLEANKRLNIPLIRRQVLTQIRGALPSIRVDSSSGHVTRRIRQQRLPPIPKQESKRRVIIKDLNDLHLDEPLDRKRAGGDVRMESGAVRKRIHKLQSRVPRPPSVEEDTPFVVEDEYSRPEIETSQSTIKQPPSPSKLRRVSSLPELWGAFLLCDLGLTSRPDRPSNKSGEQALLGLQRLPSVENFTDFRLSGNEVSSSTESKQLGEYTVQDLSKDLQSLCQPSSGNEIGVDELYPLLQAHGHGLSSRGCQRLAQYDAQQRREREGGCEEDTVSTSTESRIPSVSTPQQLIYLDVDHAVRGSSYHPSMDVESRPSLSRSSTQAPPEQSQLLSDFGGSFGGNSFRGHSYVGSSLGGSNLEQSGLRLVDTTEMLIRSPGGSQPEASAVMMNAEEFAEVDFVEADFEENASTGFPVAGFERLEDGEVSPQLPSPVPQPAVVTTRLEGVGVVRTTDVRVSERTLLNDLKLKPYGPIYNQLTGELDSSMIAELDSNLHEGQELKEIYEEIMKTLPTKHLEFTSEPTLQPAIATPVDLSRILASDTLHHRRSRRVINKSLYRPIPHPWGSEVSRTDWEKSNQYQGPEYGIKPGGGVPLVPQSSKVPHPYTTWANTWSSTINTDDYFKYVSRTESDYLRLVYHLYDSEGSDSEEEEEAKLKREHLEQQHRKLLAQEARRRQRYSAKSRYEAGLWNVNTVTMGGLGGDPDASSDEEPEIPIADHEQMSLSPEEGQKRLCELWRRLHFPESLQVDMAIKYSNPQKSSQFITVLGLWDKVACVIENREKLLSDLENFEREASDPTRFFSKGTRGSAVSRLSEAKTRDSLHKRLDSVDKQVSRIVHKLRSKYGDTVTYKGRCYQDKMSSDRTEMLYWLQQQRRADVLQLQPAVLSLPQPMVTVPLDNAI
ncbi:uncharacterized protein LOC135338299 isoform X2 [Halichondria panicea]|uniref:uncharacterized protein LOC135338299 isoform X2 n=1 Tax=Halichondria panicea TaxID=6063 RepID=UPI00312BBFAC